MQCPFFKFSWSSRWRAESLRAPAHTHTSWGKLCRNSHCRYQVLQAPYFSPLSFSHCSLFSCCVLMKLTRSCLPHHISSFLWIEMRDTEPHPILPPFLSLFSARKSTPLFTTYLSNNHFRLYIAKRK